jgi:signal transduction histidine kinase
VLACKLTCWLWWSLRPPTQIRGDLPLVAADRTKLHQIFFNLLGNSCRFTHVGTPPDALCFVLQSAAVMSPWWQHSCSMHQLIWICMRCSQAGYIRVRAVHRQGEDSVDIVVTDTGIGVAQVRAQSAAGCQACKDECFSHPSHATCAAIAQ